MEGTLVRLKPHAQRRVGLRGLAMLTNIKNLKAQLLSQISVWASEGRTWDTAAPKVITILHLGKVVDRVSEEVENAKVVKNDRSLGHR